MKKEIITVGLAVMVGATVSPAWAIFESDRALRQKATVTMIDAIKTAEQASPARRLKSI